MRKKIDVGIAPCDDFHKFSCGHFINDGRTPYHDSFSKNNDLVLNQIKTLLTEPHNDREVVAMKEAKNFYAACLNEGK